jgi:hypothetical protein
MPGFGVEPAGRGPRGMRADTPPASQGDDLHAIRLRYCGPKTLLSQPFSLTANQAIRYDLTGTPVNAVILTTETGVSKVYFGDFTSNAGKPATLAPIVGSATIDIQTLPIPLPPGDDYIFTLQEGAGSTTTGTITFMYQ